ncbi:MAG: carboxypeptidase regulatory-like domain-containing protein [Elusimicrobia bacterium]|nr:carboxypeptidase regulatory-like domain-containing protein [Candidatus Liberimonas magnetica]
MTKKNIVLNLLRFSLLLYFISYPITALAGWQTVTIDSGTSNWGGNNYSLKLDSNGNPQISYFRDGYVKHAKWNGTTWSLSTIDSTGYYGSKISMDLDSSNNPHIVYTYTSGTTVSYLKYAEWTGTAWSTSTIDSLGYTGKNASIEIDASSNLNVIYKRTDTGEIKYAKWSGSSWTIQSIAVSTTSAYISFGLDKNNYPNISYFSYPSGGLKNLKWSGTSWITLTVDTNTSAGYCDSLTVDSNGNPHIAYYAWLDKLKYAKWDSTSWNTQLVSYPGGTDVNDMEIKTDSANNPHITYVNRNDSNIYYAKWTGTSWDIKTIGSMGSYAGGFGGHPSIALDSSNNPRICYIYFDTNQSPMYSEVRYAKYTPDIYYYIKGYVKDIGGNAISGVNIDLSGDSAGSYTTTASGYYEFLNLLKAGNYTITPSKTDYSFSSINNTYANLSANQDNQNFTGTLITYYIKGYVKDTNGQVISGVTVALTGDSSQQYITSSSGYYEFTGLLSGSYTVTPTKTNYTFSPAYNTYTLTSNQTNQSFSGDLVPLISVSVSNLDFGEPKVGESKTLSFTITNTGGGTLSGTITSDKDWLTVSPASFSASTTTVTAAVNTSGLTGKNYTGIITITSNGGNKTVTVSVTPTCVIVYPNPYRISKGAPLNFWGTGVPFCEIDIYTLTGNLVKTIRETSGNDKVSWSAENDSNEKIVPGIYLYKTKNFRENNIGKFTVTK